MAISKGQRLFKMNAKKLIKKIGKIFLEGIPILLMLSLIPLVKNDYLLTLFYIIIVLIAFKVNYIKNEWAVFFGGFILMIIFECIFILTSVETFIRSSLLTIMPLWLPFLWGYGFVAIRRATIYLVK